MSDPTPNTSPTETPAAPSRQQNPLKAAGAIAALLLVAAGTVWGVMKLTGTTDSRTITYDRPGTFAGDDVGRNPFGRMAGPGGGPRIQPRNDAITRLTANSYTARTADAVTNLSMNHADVWSVRADFNEPLQLPDDVRVALQARVTASITRAGSPSTRPANLTAEQDEKLRRLPGPPGMVLSADERKQLTDLFAAYLAAPEADRAAPEKAFIDALRNLTASSRERTLALQRSRAEAVKALLKPEQIDALNRATGAR